MKILELMHSLEEAYDRFGDIDISINIVHKGFLDTMCTPDIKELIIESEEFIIKCE